MAGQAHVSVKHRRFLLPAAEAKALASLVPEAVQVGDYLTVPHTLDTTRLARNLGFSVGAPIKYYYDWANSTPFKTQRIAAATHVMNPRAFNLSQMGTGKTRAALYALDFLMREGIVRRAVVVAPLSTLSFVWGREFLEFFPHINAVTCHGDRKKRLKVLAQRPDVIIINHDGLAVIEKELRADDTLDAWIIDEIATYRNAQTTRWEVASRLIASRKYVWGLTGSPTPNEPSDAYGQIKLLNPHKVPRYFSHFKKATMRQVSQFRWVPREDANETVFGAMQPAVRFLRDECVELPPVSYVGRAAQMSGEQQRVYETLMKKLTVAFKEGQVTALNEGVLFSKLLQISAGWVYTSDRKVIDLNPKYRLDALEQVLEETERKVIVFVDFIHAAERVMQALHARKVRDVALVTGNTPSAVRDVVFNEFQRTDAPRVLVAHPKCMAHGLTLTAADTIAWYTPTTSLETYEQACARITRPGQTAKQLIAHLTGSKIEAKLYKRLQQKARTQGALLEMFEEENTHD